MAAVLAGMAVFLYLRLGHALDGTLNQGLLARADDVTALVGQADSGLVEAGGRRLVEESEGFAQVIDEAGNVLDATPRVRARPLLSPAELAEARRRTILLDRGPLPGLDQASRLLATPVRGQDQRLVVVVGASLEDRQDALEGLRTQLVIGGPVALLLASLAGYALAAAALRPVESMRRRAAEISAARTGQRLPVPRTDDELARLGETLNEMLARLEDGIARERRFVSDASHELRTPLALLKTELELALRRTRSAEELEGALRSAAEETDRLAQLAEDLLVIARADQGRLPIRREMVRAGDLLAGVTRRFEARAKALGRDVVCDAPADLSVDGDELRLGQALGNLVDNALRHGSGTVDLAARERDGRVELHVTDDGPGFPPAFLASAFERFSRADEARTRGGTGLGLAIVDVIARAHGGEARAANRPRGGADVWLILPGPAREPEEQ